MTVQGANGIPDLHRAEGLDLNFKILKVNSWM
jgi:hypothetical protein